MHEAKDYTHKVWWSEEDKLYVAQCGEMPGIMAHGDSLAAAATELQNAIAFNLELCLAEGDEIPLPSRGRC